MLKQIKWYLNEIKRELKFSIKTGNVTELKETLIKPQT